MDTLKFKRLHPDAVLPTRAHPADAGMDLRSAAPCRLRAGMTGRFSTGLAVAIPPGFVGLIRDRSSLASRAIFVGGGVIDSGYSGPLDVVLCNASAEDFVVGTEDRIAQLLVVPIATPKAEWADELPASDRGEGGFGSTDIRGGAQ